MNSFKTKGGVDLVVNHSTVTGVPIVSLKVVVYGEDFLALVPGRRRQVIEKMIDVDLDPVELQELQLMLMTEKQRAQIHARVREQAKEAAPAVGRNDPCPCGSGKKFKLCHAQ